MDVIRGYSMWNVTYFSVFIHIIGPYSYDFWCLQAVYIYIPQENNMFIGKMMKGHLILSSDKTKWKYFEQKE